MAILTLCLHYFTVSITSGYEADIMYSHQMFMYDRKRTYQAMEAFGMPVDSTMMCHPAAASYYTHLQPALKYPKIDPTAYYPSYTEDPERYQANITVSVQSQVPTSFGSSSAAIGYSGYTAYSTTPHTAFGSVAGTTDTNYSVQLSTMPQVATASAVSAMSPVRSATVDETITAPLTPPLSVSPVPPMRATSPQSIVSTIPSSAYLERDNTIGYRSASASPCIQAGDCDSTTNNDILDHKLPLHVLSDLSEGLPLPGM